MRAAALALLAACLGTAALHAKPINEKAVSISIPAGSSVVIELGKKGKRVFLVKSMDQVEMRAETAFEHDAMGSAAGKVDNGFGAIFDIVPRETPHNLPPAPKPAAKLIKFTLKRIEGRRDMILFIENGYDEAIGYRAEFSDDPMGKWEPTSSCPVYPGTIGVEQWPH